MSDPYWTNQAMRGAGRMSSQIYDTLKERLISGEHSPDSKMNVEAIRAEFSVSKQPVMEALRLLSGDGLVEIIPQVGCVVASYPLREVGDFYQMFAGFEGAIAAAAAERRTPAQVVQLRAVSSIVDALRGEQDATLRARGYRLSNRQFHAAIHAMSGSRVMAETSRRMWDLSDFLINTTGIPQPLSSAIDSRHREHEDIRAAIEAGDPAEARRAMEFHIEETIEVIHAEGRNSGTGAS